ncbi:FAD/NAD(P)-binding oxidoreductase [Novosphingobium resinovorum]
MSTYDIAIVGGGPAGLAAAERTLAAGLSICVIDEQQRPGGQILRQPPATFSVPGWLGGAPYRKGRALLDRVSGDARLQWLGGRSVLGVMPDGEGFALTLSGTAGGIEQVRARRVLVAGGCYDMPVALPGWTLPGVMSAGAVQTLIKAQQVLPGQRIVLFGTHPLMIVLAQQIVEAGGEVAAVCFAQPFAAMARTALAHLPRALRTPGPLLAAAAGIMALRRAGVPVRYGAQALRCEGTDAVERIVFSNGESIACDVAAMCYGFLPQADLIRQIGAEVRWSDPAGGWEAIHDEAMRSTVPGLYVAGETTGVAGSDAAMAEGALAGWPSRRTRALCRPRKRLRLYASLRPSDRRCRASSIFCAGSPIPAHGCRSRNRKPCSAGARTFPPGLSIARLPMPWKSVPRSGQARSSCAAGRAWGCARGGPANMRWCAASPRRGAAEKPR